MKIKDFWSTDNSLLCIHRNHHFDTIQRLHPLLHPLHPGIELGYSSFYGKMQSRVVFSFTKKEISTRVNISFFLIIIHLSSLKQEKYFHLYMRYRHLSVFSLSYACSPKISFLPACQRPAGVLSQDDVIRGSLQLSPLFHQALGQVFRHPGAGGIFGADQQIINTLC